MPTKSLKLSPKNIDIFITLTSYYIPRLPQMDQWLNISPEKPKLENKWVSLHNFEFGNRFLDVTINAQTEIKKTKYDFKI